MNLVRFLGIFVTLIVIAGGGGLTGVALSCLIGEGAACLFGFSRMASLGLLTSVGRSVLNRLLLFLSVGTAALVIRVSVFEDASVLILLILCFAIGLLSICGLPFLRQAMLIRVRRANRPVF